MKYPDLTAGDSEFLLNIIGGWEKFQQVKKGLLTIVVKTAGLLKPVATVSIPAVSRFVAKDHFTVGTSEVKIGWLGDNFREHFLAKVEKRVPTIDLAISTLVSGSLDAPILAELSDKAETTLASLWHLLCQQRSGQAGALLTNGYSNIFYIRDTGGVLWAVNARWNVSYGGWDVEAFPVGGPRRGNAGRLVVSRK